MEGRVTRQPQRLFRLLAPWTCTCCVRKEWTGGDEPGLAGQERLRSVAGGSRTPPYLQHSSPACPDVTIGTFLGTHPRRLEFTSSPNLLPSEFLDLHCVSSLVRNQPQGCSFAGQSYIRILDSSFWYHIRVFQYTRRSEEVLCRGPSGRQTPPLPNETSGWIPISDVIGWINK